LGYALAKSGVGFEIERRIFNAVSGKSAHGLMVADGV